MRKKLGIKEGSYVLTVNAPDNYAHLLAPLPEGVTISDKVKLPVDIVHIFTNTFEELLQTLAVARLTITQDGAIWVSW